MSKLSDVASLKGVDSRLILNVVKVLRGKRRSCDGSHRPSSLEDYQRPSGRPNCSKLQSNVLIRRSGGALVAFNFLPHFNERINSINNFV